MRPWLCAWLILLVSGVEICKVPKGTDGVLKVDSYVMATLQEEGCDILRAFEREHPGIGLQEVVLKDLFGYNVDDGFPFLQNMLYRNETGIEIMSLDTQWVTTLTPNLAELDGIPPERIRNKWRLHETTDSNGEKKLITMTRQTNQLVMYYRHDLFAKSNLTWPSDWENFTDIAKRLQDSVRNDENRDDFWGFALPIDPQSQNRMIYVLTTLLSGHDGGGIVEEDGVVTINNPNATRTLKMWKEWLGTICDPNNYGWSPGQAEDAFKNGNAGILLQWSDRTILLGNHSDSLDDWNIRVAPIPGRNGAGCSGDWSIGINKHTKLLDAAKTLVNSIAVNYSYYRMFKLEPIRNDVYNDVPAIWNDMQVENPLLAESIQKYTDFWERLSHRPSKGCMALYGDCVNIVYQHVVRHFVSDIRAEDSVANMEKDLKNLLGAVDTTSGTFRGNSKWTSTRIALVVVTLLCSFLWALTVALISRDARHLCTMNPGRVRVPVSVMLGAVSFISFAVANSVVIVRNDDTTRAMSEDLSAQIRLHSIYAITTSVESTIEALSSNPDVTFEMMRSRILGNIRSDLGRFRVQEGSLITLIDGAEPRRVILTNDEHLQPVGVEIANVSGLHHWVHDGLQSVPGWETAERCKTECSFSFESEGEVYLTMSWIKFHGKNSPTTRTSDDFEYDFDWLLLYMTPYEVIMGDASAALDQAIDLSIGLTAIGLLVSTCCTALITKPFIRLIHGMRAVASMEVENIATTKSTLLEVSALLWGFHKMCRMIAEYKAFMPASLFIKEDPPVEETYMPEPNSIVPVARDKSAVPAGTEPSSSASKDTSVPSAFNVFNPHIDMQQVQRNSSLVCVWYTGCRTDDITVILDCVSTGFGVLLSTTGDQSLVSFNAASRVVSHAHKACEFSVRIRDILKYRVEKEFGVGCASGTTVVSSCGSAKIKAFVALGKVAKVVRWLGEKGCSLSKVLSDNTISGSVLGHVEVMPLLVLPIEFRETGKRQVVYEARKILEVGNIEWMYTYSLHVTQDTEKLATLLAQLSDHDPSSSNAALQKIVETVSMPNIPCPPVMQELRARFGKCFF